MVGQAVLIRLDADEPQRFAGLRDFLFYLPRLGLFLRFQFFIAKILQTVFPLQAITIHLELRIDQRGRQRPRAMLSLGDGPDRLGAIAQAVVVLIYCLIFRGDLQSAKLGSAVHDQLVAS